jgi:hypothetical protein
MIATVIATTRSGSRYVLVIGQDGVQWTRLPAAARDEPMVGWLPGPPRIVPGQRLMLGDIQSTPVTRVTVLPGPQPPVMLDERLQPVPVSVPRKVRSLFGDARH